MSVRLSALVLGVVALLATAALTYAANQQITSKPRATPQVKVVSLTLVVPDLRRQVYVFAKGMLVDAGFAWKVEGAVRGFAANTVATQSPPPGLRVLDNGAPTIVLTLARNGKYGEKGTPEETSPYAGTPVWPATSGVTRTVLPVVRRAVPKIKVAVRPPKTAAAKRIAAVPDVKPRPAPSLSRPPAFTVAGAPKEPLDEMPLTRRAQKLAVWLQAHPKPTDANVRYWLYQHAWVVQGAKFGWWHGAQALKVLIQDDRHAEALWGIGAKSQEVATATLAAVEARKA
jgi:PASTA domain